MRRRTTTAVFVLVAESALVACGADTARHADTADQTMPPQVAEGQELVKRVGCVNCHGAKGQGGIGPAWVGKWGREVRLEDGSAVIFDSSYVSRSVREPSAQRRAGAAKVAMPPFGPGRLSDRELAAVIAYLESLGDPMTP